MRDELGEDGAAARFADMREVGCNPGRLLPVIEEWVAEHDGHARVVSEALWPGRSYPETVECLRHEAVINHALADSPATILCPYDADGLDADALAGAEMTHRTVLEGGNRRPSDSYGDPVELMLAERWPQESPRSPVSEHRFAGSLGELRHAVADDPLVGSLSAQRRADLVLAVNEATTNAIRHGDGACTASIWHDGRSVVSEISSPSHVEDPLAGRRRPRGDAQTGRGLWLINQLCDLVELRSASDRTTLRMHMRTV
jgi:anti-sigma regulatory factor (Ser/Thr protein kinase)